MTSITETVRPRTGWLAAGAFAGLALAIAFGPALSAKPARAVDGTTTTPEHTISVAGTGTIKIKPDVADLSLGVSITRQTVKAARADAAEKMASVIAALKKAGIADADIQTTDVSLSPVYDYNNNGNNPRITGYQVSNTVTVVIRDLDATSDVIDSAMGAGATNMNGLSFRVNDPAGAQAQAREAAVKDARSKADALAKAAGVAITGVQSIAETSYTAPMPIAYEMAAGAKAADVATPIQTGTNEVSISVSIVFLID